MPGGKRFENLALALFGCILLLGEAFKLNLGVKLSLPLLLIVVTFFAATNKSLRFYQTFLDGCVYLYGAVFLLFTLVGIVAGHHLGDVFEDLYPILVFVLLFAVWRSFSAGQFERLWRRLVLFAVLAAVKVVLLAVLPLDVAWDNNWQAMKEALPLAGFYRIILRGGDAFLSMALVYFLIDVQRKGATGLWKRLSLIGLLLFAVFISLSRSSFLAIGVALFLCFFLFRQLFSAKRLVIFSSVLLLVLLALLPFFNTISLAASIFEARTEAFDADDIAVDFRKDERSLALKKAASVYYMGNGLGSYFYLDLSGSEKKDERSIYVHDFNTWLVFKAGFAGLVLFYLIFLGSAYNLFWCLRQKNFLNEEQRLFVLTLFAGGIVIVVISFLANKLSTLSGSVFFAFYAAASARLKKSYEGSV